VAEYLNFESLLAFLTLTALEIVLGIDNLIFIAVQTAHLPPDQRERGRRLGLLLAVVSRIALLLGISWVMKLTSPIATILGHEITGRDLVLVIGGVFLIHQATVEIHENVERQHRKARAGAGARSLRAMLFQVTIMDIVFSLDSVITAVGMSKQVPVMIAAILTSVVVMLVYSGLVIRFVDRNPTIKLLALAFLLLIGVLLVAEGFHQEIDKGYIYFAMAFSLVVELLQMRAAWNETKSQHPAGQTEQPAHADQSSP
jgi:predicted tellurium resistance membrane protein TerC